MLKLLADINDKVLSFSAGNTSFQFSFCFSYSVIYIYVPALLGAGEMNKVACNNYHISAILQNCIAE